MTPDHYYLVLAFGRTKKEAIRRGRIKSGGLHRVIAERCSKEEYESVGFHWLGRYTESGYKWWDPSYECAKEVKKREGAKNQ